MTMFNGYIMVDWSAANVSAPENESPNAIWTACWIDGKSYPPRYHRTRLAVFDYLTLIMKATKEKGQRLLIGLDFAFGYPADSYGKFCFKDCDDWKDLWKLISTNIKDNIKNYENWNNRFYVASDFNKCFPDNNGPFWGRPTDEKNKDKYPYLKNNPSQGYGNTLPSEFRHVENAVRNPPRILPKSVWHLFDNFPVGGQTLMGIPTLHKLKECKKLDCVIWPFENIDDKDKHVIAEIYPSIWDIQGDHPIRDANQVYTVAKNIAYLDENELLQKFLNAPFDYERDNKINEGDIIKKEGWMLGIDENGRPAKCP